MPVVYFSHEFLTLREVNVELASSRHAKADRSPGSGPDFLCIGAPRSGTTFLYNVLRCHPDMWLTPVKELHYFDIERERGRRRFTYGQSLRSILAHGRRAIGGDALAICDLRFHLRYALPRRTDAWYVSLFDAAAHRTTGEITPGYCALSSQRVSDIRALCGPLKIVYVMRDPLDRAWSTLTGIAYRRQVGVGDIPLSEYLRVIETPSFRLRADYGRTLRIWQDAFGKENLHVLQFDALTKTPQETIGGILSFLDLSSESAANLPYPDQPVNSWQGAEIGRIPDEIERKLAEILLPNMASLEPLYPTIAKQWTARLRRILDNADQPVRAAVSQEPIAGETPIDS